MQCMEYDKNYAICCSVFLIKSHYGTLLGMITWQKSQKFKPYKMFKKSLICADFRVIISRVILA